MPYALAINSSGANACGENAVNSGAAGKLDGFSIVLGHEIEETATDPGAEDVIGTGTSATQIGGWYDALDANENGDKCAWVGESLGLPGQSPGVSPIPGAMGDITGNQGADVRRPVAVVQPGGRRSRLLRRGRHRPARSLSVAPADADGQVRHRGRRAGHPPAPGLFHSTSIR